MSEDLKFLKGNKLVQCFFKSEHAWAPAVLKTTNWFAVPCADCLAASVHTYELETCSRCGAQDFSGRITARAHETLCFNCMQYDHIVEIEAAKNLRYNTQ